LMFPAGNWKLVTRKEILRILNSIEKSEENDICYKNGSRSSLNTTSLGSLKLRSSATAYLLIEWVKDIYFYCWFPLAACHKTNKSYNFTAVPQSWSNPGADVSYKFYFGVPLLSVFLLVPDRAVFQLMIYLHNGVDFNTKLRMW
jgi:hypothetical protein